MDDFKHYNDTNGHLAGDDLLERLAKVVRRNIRNIDIPARYGGEEFVIILPETSDEEAMQVAERIRQAVERESFPFERRQPGGKVTISVGVSSYPGEAKTPRELLNLADRALYRAKVLGKNRVICYSSEQSVNENKDIENQSDKSGNEEA